MIKNNFYKWQKKSSFSVIFFFLTILLTLFTACKKNDNSLGKDLLDPSDLLSSGAVDTFDIISYTIEDTNVFTKDPRFGLLGIINDREFGIVDLGFYTQVKLSGLNPNFGDVSQVTIDSFVLALEYAGSYGYAGYHTVQVFEVDEKMYSDSTYRSSQDLLVKNENWVDGSGSLKFDPNAITVVGQDTIKTQLRIPLKPSKALQIIQDAQTHTAEFGNNTLFSKNYLKGLYVKTDGVAPALNKGMVGYFDLLDQDSKIIIYYKENGVSRPPFDLVMNYECVDFNRYKYSNAGTKVAAIIADSTLGKNEFYMQSGKYRAAVSFPSIKNLPKNIVVHSAKLYLPVQNLVGSKFAPSGTVKTFVKGTNIVLGDTGYEPYFKGYVIDVRDYIQSYSIGNISSETLIISGNSFVQSAERIIFNGIQTDKKNKPKLILSYTEF